MRLAPIFLFAIASQAAVARDAALGNLMLKCNSFIMFTHENYDGYAFKAICEHPEDGPVMELDKCIGNDNGKLV